MLKAFSAINTKGFSSSISSGYIPQNDHITYEGTFNELSFTVGPKATKQMELYFGYSRAQYIQSAFDKQIHNYLAIFTKGSSDGEDRDERRLNSVICLDISGSMAGSLNRKKQGNRLQLSKQAIKMFFSKLRDNDSFGLVVFNNQADTIIPCKLKKQHNQKQVFDLVQKIVTYGGTTLSSGFQKSCQNLLQFFASQSYSKENSSQNRIIMLTDVCDNSLANEHNFVKNVSQSEFIHTTIIGISQQFQSQTCQSLNQIQGFNYLCATQQQDLKKHLFQNFNYTFFPSNYDIKIQLIQNKQIKEFQVFGTVDKKKVHEYNNNFKQIYDQLIITKTKSSFPSELQFDQQNNIKQFGGLIIVKLNMQIPVKNKFEGVVKLSYRNIKNRQIQNQLYHLAFQFPQNQQYYSSQSLAEAMPAFFYVNQIKRILQKFNSKNNKLNRQDKLKYLNSLEKLKTICPQSKIKELEDLIEVIKKKVQQQK